MEVVILLSERFPMAIVVIKLVAFFFLISTVRDLVRWGMTSGDDFPNEPKNELVDGSWYALGQGELSLTTLLQRVRSENHHTIPGGNIPHQR